jgi:hypothetical protein
MLNPSFQNTRTPLPSRETLMEFISSTVTTAAVATIYVIYSRYLAHVQRKDRTLRERVTYMLWCAAEQLH